MLTSATGAARITVTGTGNVTGTPNQLVLAMGVQVTGSSVGSALADANDAVKRVTAALRADGVAAADIQTSGLSIYPNYPNNSQTPNGYSVSESLTATLNSLAAAGTQIEAAVHAGGDATTVSGISLNLTDTSTLLAQARARAVADATAKAAQYAKALGEPLGPVVSITDQAPTQPFPCTPRRPCRLGESLRADLTRHPAAQRLHHRGIRGLTEQARLTGSARRRHAVLCRLPPSMKSAIRSWTASTMCPPSAVLQPAPGRPR